MPTRNVSLTAEEDAFIEEVLDKGEYRNASEAIRDAAPCNSCAPRMR